VTFVIWFVTLLSGIMIFMVGLTPFKIAKCRSRGCGVLSYFQWLIGLRLAYKTLGRTLNQTSSVIGMAVLRLLSAQKSMHM